jgi:hypothetical protein
MLVKIRGSVQHYSVLSRMCPRVCGEWVIIVTPAIQLPDIVRTMRSLATNGCNYSQCHIAKCRYWVAGTRGSYLEGTAVLNSLDVLVLSPSDIFSVLPAKSCCSYQTVKYPSRVSTFSATHNTILAMGYCLATSFDLVYRSSSGQLYKNMNIIGN